MRVFLPNKNSLKSACRSNDLSTFELFGGPKCNAMYKIRGFIVGVKRIGVSSVILKPQVGSCN